MNSILPQSQNENAVSNDFKSFFTEYHVGKILKHCNAYKKSGIPVITILLCILSTVFTGMSLYMERRMGFKTIPFGKDTYYRLMSSPNINWRRYVSMLAAAVHEKIIPLTSDSRKNALIIDDSPCKRNCSRKVEMLGNCLDHNDHRYYNGFRTLTLGWTDGNTFLPVSFCLLTNQDPEKRRNKNVIQFDRRTNAAHQKHLAEIGAPACLMELLKDAKKAGIKAKHLLADSWFGTPKTILEVKELGYDMVCMIKTNRQIAFTYNGKRTITREIHDKESAKQSDKKSPFTVSVMVTRKNDKRAIPAKLVFVPQEKKHDEYFILLSTDTSMDANEIIALYGKRWKIETFFQTCKGFLKFAKETRAIDYNSLTAHVAIVFTRYMMLAVKEREAEDERTLGELFYICVQEMQDITLEESLRLLNLWAESISEILNNPESIDKNVILKALLNETRKFINSLPTYLTKNLLNAA